ATTAVSPPPQRLTVRQRLNRWDVKASPYLYIAPYFVIFALVGLFPLIYTAWMSLHRWRLGGSSPEAYVGLENYRTLIEDDLFWNALRNTISIFVISSSTQIVFALLLAVLLNEQIRFRTGFRIALLLPYAMSLVAVGIIFSNLFGDQFGFINTMLDRLGLGPVGWHQDTAPSHLAISTMVNWRWTGYNALIFLAAMQAIPNDLYEAARVDGANAWQRFWHVTVPSLRPVIIFVVITSTIGGLQIFTEPRMFDTVVGSNSGGAQHQYQTIVLLLVQEGFRNARLGYAATIAWALFLIIIVFAVLNFLVFRRIASAEVDDR
ncbi:MAG: sugar ABC transporter permease, partial [Sporichthyaceae bacterium]|nr:sugar ABC transporter permease [Sporichthyaceae bacterium]